MDIGSNPICVADIQLGLHMCTITTGLAVSLNNWMPVVDLFSLIGLPFLASVGEDIPKPCRDVMY